MGKKGLHFAANRLAMLAVATHRSSRVGGEAWHEVLVDEVEKEVWHEVLVDDQVASVDEKVVVGQQLVRSLALSCRLVLANFCGLVAILPCLQKQRHHRECMGECISALLYSSS